MSELTVLDSTYSWRRLALSLGIAVIINVGMWAAIVVLPGMQSDFGLGRAEASLPYTFTMFGFAFGNLVIGRIVDRHGVALALAGAGIVAAAGFALTALAQSLWLVCLAQAAIGLATSAGFGPLIADVSLWFMKRRGIAVAIAASGNYLAGALWPWLLKGVIAEDGWRTAYFILAALILFAMVPLTVFLRRRLPLEALARADADTAARMRATGFSPRALMWILGLAGVACCVAMSMPQVHIVAFCVDMGYGPAVGAEMLALMLLGGVGSRLVSGLLADRLGGVRTLLIGSVLQTVGLILYLPTSGLASLYVVSLVFGLSQGGIVPSYAVIVREYMPAREAGARTGFVMMATILGMALGGWMSGWIYDMTGSYRAAFLNGIAWNLLNVGIMVMVLMRGRPRAVPA